MKLIKKQGKGYLTRYVLVKNIELEDEKKLMKDEN